MSATVDRVELFDWTEDDPLDGPHRTYCGTVWEVRCSSHGETHHSDHQAQAESLAQNTASFCHACADHLRHALTPADDDYHADQVMELRERRRADERERDYDRTGRA